MSGRWVKTETKQKAWLWERVSFDNERIRPDNEGEWVIVKYNPFNQMYYIILCEAWEGLQRLDAIKHREVSVHLHKVEQLNKESLAIWKIVLGEAYFE